MGMVQIEHSSVAVRGVARSQGGGAEEVGDVEDSRADPQVQDCSGVCATDSHIGAFHYKRY